MTTSVPLRRDGPVLGQPRTRLAPEPEELLQKLDGFGFPDPRYYLYPVVDRFRFEQPEVGVDRACLGVLGAVDQALDAGPRPDCRHTWRRVPRCNKSSLKSNGNSLPSWRPGAGPGSRRGRWGPIGRGSGWWPRPTTLPSTTTTAPTGTSPREKAFRARRRAAAMKGSAVGGCGWLTAIPRAGLEFQCHIGTPGLSGAADARAAAFERRPGDRFGPGRFQSQGDW